MSHNPMSQKLRKFRNRFDISTSQFSICHDISRIKSTSNCQLLGRTPLKENEICHLDTLEALGRELKLKDAELQNCIQEIVRREKEHEAELAQIEMEYEKEMNELHEMVTQEIQKNKELQERINVVRMLGLETSSDSSLLLGDL